MQRHNEREVRLKTAIAALDGVRLSQHVCGFSGRNFHPCQIGMIQQMFADSVDATFTLVRLEWSKCTTIIRCVSEQCKFNAIFVCSLYVWWKKRRGRGGGKNNHGMASQLRQPVSFRNLPTKHIFMSCCSYSNHKKKGWNPRPSPPRTDSYASFVEKPSDQTYVLLHL